MARRRKPSLVTQFLEDISREALEKHFDVVTRFIGRRNGIYALFRRQKLHYVGLTTDLRWRLKHHLRDRLGDSWDSFSVYLTIGDRHLRELESIIVRIVEPPGNSQLGRFSGAQDIARQFEREISDKQKRERNRLLMREAEEEEVRHLIPRAISIHARYKGRTIKAKLRRDLSIRWKGQLYGSPSAAAHAVCKRPVNGWWFWHYQRSPGDWARIDDLRYR